MNSHPPAPWTDVEMRMIHTVDVFLHKPAIMKKAQTRLENLKTALADHLQQSPGACPPQADIEKGQIARGENHKGFPFLSLDLPQLFSKQCFFTFRTLFWWGHYLGFALILKGANLEAWVEGIIRRRELNGAADLHLALHETPWEWELEPTRLPRLNNLAAERIREHAAARGYIKLLRVVPVTSSRFTGLDWPDAGLTAYQDINRLLAPSQE
ncbi:MAG: hypothetical protein ACE5ER_12050 [Nitrospinaceae bacterium]